MSEPIDVINQFTGEKWYYSDTVKEHFFNPRNLLLTDPKEEEFNATGLVGSPACVIPTTLIQTNPATEAIQNVPIATRVLSDDGLFHPVFRILKPKHKGKIVVIKNQLGGITASPDHLILAMQIPRSKSYFFHTAQKKKIPVSWAHASELKKGDICLYPIPKEVREVKKIDIPAYKRKKWDFRSQPLPSSVKITDELLELFGYFIAEGHTRTGKGEVGFTFSEKEEAYVKRAIFLMGKYFKVKLAECHRPKQHRIDLAGNNVQLAELFREWFGSGAEHKKVPEFILFLPPELQRGLLRGLWRGDGHFSAPRAQPRAGFTTISHVLIQQMRWLLLRQKIAPSMYREKASVAKGVNHRASYRIHVGDMASLKRLSAILKISFKIDSKKRHAEEVWFDEKYLYLPIRKISKEAYSGRLYNFEVDTSHTYATDAFLVHNCGDMMHIWMKIDPETERVKDLKWRTFGCGSAIAATSMFSVMVTENGGLTLDEARAVKPQHIMERLGGLPNRKIHCSVLVDKAFDKAANNYYREIGKYDKVVIEGAKVIDPDTQTTDKDIEEAVLEGAMDLDSVQKKLKVGIGNPEVVPEVEQLIRFYKEKYYG